MIDAICKGQFSTFTIPVEDTEYSNYEGYRWDGTRLWVKWKGPYDHAAKETIYFGWTRTSFPDCCGADLVYSFTSIAYGAKWTGLKDPRTPRNTKYDELFKACWEPWYNEVVSPAHKAAIGIIASNVEKDGSITERSAFYTWLKTKGKPMGQFMNKIYQNSLLEPYLFVHPDNKILDISFGSKY